MNRELFEFDSNFVLLVSQNDPLTHNLLNFEFKKWRSLRTTLTPVFTCGKLKRMFPLILKCADHLKENIEKMVNRDEIIECRELTAKYTTDAISICAFGIDTNALSDENSEFRKMGKAIVTPSRSNMLWYLMKHSSPWFYDILANIIPISKATQFFLRIAQENIHQRQIHNIIRHDFIDILIELKNHPDKIGDIGE